MKRLAAGLLACCALIAPRVPVFLRDASGIVGGGLIAYGAWMISPAAGFITAGVLMLIGSILSALAPAERN